MITARDAKTGRLTSVKTPEERFWPKVLKGEGCWLWQSTMGERGYGQFTVSAARKVGAHRFAWELTHGPIASSDLYVCHHCDNPSCVRPDHLFLGTTQENMDDRKRKGRYASISGASSHFFGKSKRGTGGKLTPQQVAEIRALKAPGWTYRLGVAAQFGVSQAHVWRIWKGECW